jgi:hypothetical protein
MYWLGWGFDVLTAVLSVVDVVSDGLVAQQFYDEGAMLWFWLVVGSLFISNVLYAAGGVIVLHDQHNFDTAGAKKSFMWFSLLFPIAQALPLAHWLAQCWRDRHDTCNVPPASTTGKPMPTAATADDLEGCAAEAALIARFNAGFETHMRQHAGFYMETVVEAVPQAVIQLLAVTALGRASPVQLLSMSLSLFSIVSKAYAVTKVFDLRLIIFNASAVAYDAFALFYLFSTLAAANEASEVTVSMGLAAWVFPFVPQAITVSALSAEWVLRHQVVEAFAAGSLVVLGIGLFYEERIKSNDIWHWSIVICPLAALACFIPAMLVIESVKLMCFVPFVLGVADNYDTASWPSLHRFYQVGARHGGWCEQKKRLRHIAISSCDQAIAQIESASQGQTWARGRPMAKSARRSNKLQVLQKLRQTINIEPFNPWLLAKHPNRVTGATPVPRRARKRASEAIAVAWATSGGLLFIYTALCNAVFPIAHVYRYGLLHLNLLQGVCLAGCAVSLPVAMYLAPGVCRSMLFCYSLEHVRSYSSVADPAAIIAAYHQPQAAAVLRAVIDPEVLPATVLDDVALVLGGNGIDVAGLSAAYCRDLRAAATAF